MRERAAAMWLEQLRQNHDRRRSAAQRSVEISEYERNRTTQKINDKENSHQATQRANQDFRDRRSEAFIERSQYLQAAKQHAQAVQSAREQQIDHTSAVKAARGEQLKAEAVATRQMTTFQKNQQRQQLAAQNNEMLEQCRQDMNHRKMEADAAASQRVATQRMMDDEQRRVTRHHTELYRRDTKDRAHRLDQQRRAAIEHKVATDHDRSARVLNSRADYLRNRAAMNREREAQKAAQVQRANQQRAAKEREWETHFEESVAIGRETAEHNKLFKLNNKIMHQLMMESQPQISGRRRSVGSPAPGR